MSVDLRIAAAVGGDNLAAAALLRELLPRVRNLVRYVMRTDDIDDAVQDSMVAVLRGLPTYRGDGSLKSWSDRIVIRVAIEASRRRRSAPETPDMAESLDGGALPDEYVARRRMVLALDRLSGEMREALVLHHVLELTVPEIASELGEPPETIRSRLRNGRAKLRELMEER